MSFKPIREYAADGTLTRAGFAWTEAKYAETSNMVIMAVIGVIACVIGGFMLLGGNLIGIVPAGLGGAVVARFYIWRRDESAQKRAFCFEADGGTTAPYGLSGQPNYVPGSIRIQDIASIEGKTDRGVLGLVVMILRSGKEVRLADSIREAEVQMITVQLNLALTEMRMTIGGSFKLGNVEVVIN